MKAFILIFFLFNSFSAVFAQGVWNIKYISIDSLNTKLVGKEVRLDFKTSEYDTLNKDFDIRYVLSKNDTVTLEVDGQNIELIEDWKFYVDHGVLKDQTLQIKTKHQVIREQFIESINDATIVVKMNFYKPANCKTQKMTLSESKLVTIDKKLIKGVLFRRNCQVSQRY
uniref:hypothetical protein n=1 Tax=Flavobacterium sp. TaxID=239 RepID=UPI004049CA71